MKVKTGPAVLLFALLIVRAWPGIAFAAEGDPSRPIHIQADTLTYNKTTRIYHGTGHVMVVQGPLRLDADGGHKLDANPTEAEGKRGGNNRR